MTGYQIGLTIALAASLAQLAPVVVALRARRRLTGARAWVVAWAAVATAMDFVIYWTTFHHEQNLWLAYVDLAVLIAMALWAFSLWQATEMARLTMRLTLVGFTAAYLILTVAFDNTSSFSRAAQPMGSLVGLGASAYTLVALSLRSHGSLVRQDWFWVSAGFALYFGAICAVSPLSLLLFRVEPRLVELAFDVRNGLILLAMVAVARGIALAPAIGARPARAAAG